MGYLYLFLISRINQRGTGGFDWNLENCWIMDHRGAEVVLCVEFCIPYIFDLDVAVQIEDELFSYFAASINGECFMLCCDVLLDHGIFNVALQTLLDKDRKKFPHLRVPLIFQEVCV